MFYKIYITLSLILGVFRLFIHHPDQLVVDNRASTKNILLPKYEAAHWCAMRSHDVGSAPQKIGTSIFEATALGLWNVQKHKVANCFCHFNTQRA